ncbi:hypothetical protein COOONC_23190 [Cooperia oncophora]
MAVVECSGLSRAITWLAVRSLQIVTCLQQHFSKESLGKALECLKTNPRHLLFYHPVKFELRHTFPAAKVSLYSEKIDDTTYCCAHSKHNLAKTLPFSHMTASTKKPTSSMHLKNFYNDMIFSKGNFRSSWARTKITKSVSLLAAEVIEEISQFDL